MENIKFVFIIIIIYIIINEYMNLSKAESDEKPKKNVTFKKDRPPQLDSEYKFTKSYEDEASKEIAENDANNRRGMVSNITLPPSVVNKVNEKFNEEFSNDFSNEVKNVWTFDKPEPWSKIVLIDSEYPYHFYLKVRIPSLNDLQSWQKIVPNIEFDPRSGEIVIPSKDESSALALANLMVMNFMGQTSLENILKNNLIQISVSNAKTHEVVQNKLKEQIMENLYGKTSASGDSTKQFEVKGKDNNPDMIDMNKNLNNRQPIQNNSKQPEQRVDFQSEKFKDTFEHFNEPNKNQQSRDEWGVQGWEADDYTYL